MSSWLERFLGTDSNFMPHGHCYLWRPDILWTHVTADTLIALAYIAIPTSIAIIAWRHAHNAGDSLKIAFLFAAFIILCGITHLFNIYVIWNPVYELQSYLKALTALASVATAIVVALKTRYLFHLLSIEASNQKIKSLVEKHREKEAQLEKIYGASETRELRIIELKKEVNELLLEQGRPQKYDPNVAF
ncbi:MAG TPA: hypothetical protein VIC26_00420 [Marinagarivorans sp.]